jgi:hypothetical protein
MGKVVDINNIQTDLAKLRSNGGMWQIDNGKFAIKHFEVEKLAARYDIQVEPFLQSCNLEKGCVVVKAVAEFKGKKYITFGEVSPLNNDYMYPVSVAEKRAADRAILKALGIHGQVYSNEELPNLQTNNNENVGLDLNISSIILERIKNIASQANLDQLASKNKKYLTELKTKDSKKFDEIVKAFKDRKQQLIGG